MNWKMTAVGKMGFCICCGKMSSTAKRLQKEGEPRRRLVLCKDCRDGLHGLIQAEKEQKGE